MITGDISETELLDLRKDMVKVITNDGEEFQGQITFILLLQMRYIHSILNNQTLRKIKDGQTAKVIVSATPEPAHIVPLSILRLDEAGNIGRVVKRII